MKVKSLSHVWLFATPWTAAYQAPPSTGFSRQEYWSGVPLPSLIKATYICLNILKMFINKLFNKYILYSYLDVHNKIDAHNIDVHNNKIGKNIYKSYGFYMTEVGKLSKSMNVIIEHILVLWSWKINIQVSNKDIIKKSPCIYSMNISFNCLYFANMLLCYYNEYFHIIYVLVTVMI